MQRVLPDSHNFGDSERPSSEYTQFDYDAIDGAGERPDLGALEFLKRVVSFIRSQPRARLTVDCLMLALGDNILEGESMTSVGVRHGMTKQAISIRVKEIQKKLHLGHIRGQKLPEASKSYANSNWRPKRIN